MPPASPQPRSPPRSACSSKTGLTGAGGWVTLAFAVLAWYHAAGDIIAATFGRAVLPVWAMRK